MPEKISDQKAGDIVKYWFLTSKENYKTMQTLFENKRYADCLFFGHLILEKILKANVVKTTQMPAPYSHDLPHLFRMSGLILDGKAIKLLKEVSRFNIEARYPDFKFKFYKKCTRIYTSHFKKEIGRLYLKLCQKIQSSES